MSTQPDGDAIRLDEVSLSDWHAGLREGNSQATKLLWELYFDRMVDLARRKLQYTHRATRDEEDVALSAFKSFCLGLKQGRFLEKEGDANLWPLLVTLTINKAIDQVRRTNRLKRGGASGGDASKGVAFHSAQEVLDHLASQSPSPDMIAATNDAFDHLFETLDRSGDEQLRHVAIASFQGDSPSDIAKSLGCSTRTVQRKLRTIKAVWEEHG
ncbi:MAG: ECF-type sigma factor [Planctomycetota bacterium]